MRAAIRIIDELVELREDIKRSAEGFAVIDFVQGHVATDLPIDLARNIVDILRARRSREPDAYCGDLVVLWLEHYRRAYSHMIMRILEDGAADSLTA